VAETEGGGKLSALLAQRKLHLLHFQACVVKKYRHVSAALVSHVKHSRMFSCENGLVLAKDAFSVFL